jgi:hypothetical protein
VFVLQDDRRISVACDNEINDAVVQRARQENILLDVKDIIVPATVAVISTRFKVFPHLKSVSLAEGSCLREIAAQSFRGCTELVSVHLENASLLKHISDDLCGDCSRLREVILPSKLETIGNDAFVNCTALERIVIPATVRTIESRVFKKCTALGEVIFAEGSELQSIGKYAFFRTKLSRIELPQRLKIVEEYAFAESSLESIVLPPDVTTIGQCSFGWCSSLASVELSSQLASIGAYSFIECSALQTITIPSSVVIFGKGVFRLLTNQTQHQPQKITQKPSHQIPCS